MGGAVHLADVGKHKQQLSQHPNMNERQHDNSGRLLRVAMVGCGNISSYHLDAIRALKPRRVIVTAVVDPDDSSAATFSRAVTKKLQQRVEPRIFRTIDDALAADPRLELFEACDVMVPSWDTPESGDLHESVAVKVLQSGRHLMLEKPIAVTSVAAKRIIKAHHDRHVQLTQQPQVW